MIFKKDNLLFGAILGMIAPIIGFFIYKFVNFKSYPLPEMYRYMKQNPSFFTVALSLSLLANAVIFTFYVNAHKDKTAKGIFAFTCIYGLVILLIKTF